MTAVKETTAFESIEIDDLNLDFEAKKQYEDLVAKGVEAIKNEEFKKVVLSRMRVLNST